MEKEKGAFSLSPQDPTACLRCVFLLALEMEG